MRSSALHFFRRHGLAVLIGAVVVALLGIIGVETQWGSSFHPATVLVAGQVTKGGETSLLPAFGLPGIDTGFKETVDRPLFSASRRPVPVASNGGQPTMKKGQFRLAGTVINRDIPFVFLVEIATGKGMRVAKGADIMSTGISVAEVDAVRVVLKQGEETEELSLRTASSPVAPTPLPGPPGAAPAAAMQRPPPAGVVVSAVPAFNASAPVARGSPPIAATVPQPGSSVLPGFVQSPESGAPNTAPVNPSETAVGNQRRRRVQNVPQQ